jgi:hypothetical protein
LPDEVAIEERLPATDQHPSGAEIARCSSSQFTITAGRFSSNSAARWTTGCKLTYRLLTFTAKTPLGFS